MKGIYFQIINKRPLEYAFLFSLLLIILLFYSFKEFDINSKTKSYEPPLIIINEIPPVEKVKRPTPPEKPKIPVESDLEDFPEHVTIAPTDFSNLSRLTDIPEPPEAPDDPIVPFELLSQKPEIIYMEKTIYPELARKIGIEGTVYITVTIGKTGLVEQAEILKSIPMLDEAALSAAKKCRFKPAKQRDRFVRVKVSMPFKFKLH